MFVGFNAVIIISPIVHEIVYMVFGFLRDSEVYEEVKVAESVDI